MSNLSTMVSMSYFSEKLSKLLEMKKMSPYKLALEAKLDSGLVYKVLEGTRGPSDGLMEKIASVAALEITYERLLSWRIVDEYPEKALELALEEQRGRKKG